MITYKRPTTIGQKLTNYKDLALNKTRKPTKGGSRHMEKITNPWYQPVPYQPNSGPPQNAYRDPSNGDV